MLACLSILLWYTKVIKRDVLKQALIVVSLSYLATTGLAIHFFFQGIKGTELAFYTWWPVPLITGVAVILICILASLISVRRVMVLEPAIVFRG